MQCIADLGININRVLGKDHTVFQRHFGIYAFLPVRWEDIEVKSVNQKYWPIVKLPAPPHTKSAMVSCLLWWGAGFNPKQIKNETTGSVG